MSLVCIFGGTQGDVRTSLELRPGGSRVGETGGQWPLPSSPSAESGTLAGTSATAVPDLAVLALGRLSPLRWGYRETNSAHNTAPQLIGPWPCRRASL